MKRRVGLTSIAWRGCVKPDIRTPVISPLCSTIEDAESGGTGNYGSLGVFLMATNSYEENWIPEGVTPKTRPPGMAAQQNQSVPLNLAGTA